MKLLEIDGISAAIHYCGENFIICCHGLYSNKDSKKYVELAEKACRNGISCVRFDFRGCGKSKGKFEDSILSNRVKDLDKVVNFVKKEYNGNISLFGSSFGGMVAIVYAYQHKIKPIALISTPYKIDGIDAKFVEDANRYDLLKMMKNLSHVLIIHGKKDELVPYTHAEKLYANARHPKKLLLLNSDHSFSDDAERNKALNEVILWVKSAQSSKLL